MASNSTEASINKDNVSIIDKDLVKLYYFVGTGVIIFIGFICNSLSVAVFVKAKSLRHSTTGLYLASLAVADFLFLLGHMLRWLDRYGYIPGYTFYNHSNASCQFTHALRYSAKLTSAWITVSITAQRFVIIAFPLRAESLCTRRKAYIVIASTFVLCFIVGSLFPTFTLGMVTHNGRLMCGYKNKKVYDILSWIVLRVGSILLPGAIILVLTILICVLLSKARATRNQQLNGQQSVTTASKKTRSLDRQLTIMLLAVALAFIALRLPYTILYYIDTFTEGNSGRSYELMYLFLKIGDLLATLNYAINFFLYCFSGSTFRKEFFIMFHCDSAFKRVSTWSWFGHSTGTTNVANNGHNDSLVNHDSPDFHQEVQEQNEYPLVPYEETRGME